MELPPHFLVSRCLSSVGTLRPLRPPTRPLSLPWPQAWWSPSGGESPSPWKPRGLHWLVLGPEALPRPPGGVHCGTRRGPSKFLLRSGPHISLYLREEQRGNGRESEDVPNGGDGEGRSQGSLNNCLSSRSLSLGLPVTSSASREHQGRIM